MLPIATLQLIIVKCFYILFRKKNNQEKIFRKLWILLSFLITLSRISLRFLSIFLFIDFPLLYQENEWKTKIMKLTGVYLTAHMCCVFSHAHTHTNMIRLPFPSPYDLLKIRGHVLIILCSFSLLRFQWTLYALIVMIVTNVSPTNY